MNLVCFDSDVLVWGVLGREQAGFEEMLTRVPAFIRQLDDEGRRILVPSVVVAELLLGLPTERHPKFLEAMSRNFFVAPFDVSAATAFAELWQQRRTDGTVKSLQNATPRRTKTELKADAMVIATAISRSATEIYSHDQGLKAMAGSRIRVFSIPRVERQPDLFPDRALKLVPPKSGKDSA